MIKKILLLITAITIIGLGLGIGSGIILQQEEDLSITIAEQENDLVCHCDVAREDLLTEDDVLRIISGTTIGETIQGPKGEKGDKGDKGEKGEKGDSPTSDEIIDILWLGISLDGAVGSPNQEIPWIIEALKGDKGDKGEKGDDGISIMGPIGPKGEKGDRGDSGTLQGQWRRYCKYQNRDLKYYPVDLPASPAHPDWDYYLTLGTQCSPLAQAILVELKYIYGVNYKGR